MAITKQDAKQAMRSNSSLYILHAAIAVLEELPNKSPVDAKKVSAWISEMREEAGICLSIQDDHVSP